MRGLLKKTIHVLIEGLFILASLILVFTIFIFIMQVKPAVVLSGSMEPTIHTGSLLLIDTKYTDVKKRDIVVFETGGILVTHRVVEIKDKGIVTKGDANDIPDLGVIEREDLMGRAVMWVPSIGYAVNFLSSLKGIILINVFCIVMLIIYLAFGKEARINDKKKNSNIFNNSAT